MSVLVMQTAHAHTHRLNTVCRIHLSSLRELRDPVYSKPCVCGVKFPSLSIDSPNPRYGIEKKPNSVWFVCVKQNSRIKQHLTKINTGVIDCLTNKLKRKWNMPKPTKQYVLSSSKEKYYTSICSLFIFRAVTFKSLSQFWHTVLLLIIHLLIFIC